MNSQHIIAASILSADLARLGDDVAAVLNARADWIHFDVMDNHYVPNLTFGPVVCKALRQFGITAPIDVHLMVTPVDHLIEAFANAGASHITIHPQATHHLDRSLQLIKQTGCQVGVALNPATSTHELEEVLDMIDLVLLMSVNPGFGGQTFIPRVMDKISQVRTLIDQTKRPIRLAVDGGVASHNIAQIAQAGADTFVVGSALFNSSDYAATLAALRQALGNTFPS